MEFYKIENPTTREVFAAIIAGEYVPFEHVASKAKQIKVLLIDHWGGSDLFVTFSGVTNAGGLPIFFTNKTNLWEVASEQKRWYEMTSEEQDEEVELLGSYMRSYDEFFGF